MLESWWRSVSPGLPRESRTSYNHVLRQSQAFYSILDQFARLLSEAAAAQDNDEEWQSILSRYFDTMRKEAFKSEFSSGGKPGIYSWVSPITIWQQMLSGMPHEPAGLFREMMTDDYRDFFQKLLTLPGADQYSAEYQEKIREGMKLWDKFFNKSREYHALYEKLGIAALDLLEKKLLELGGSGGKISSLRELYNLWIDCNEQTFSEYMKDDHYSKIYSELVNLLMEIKTHSIEILEEVFSLYNMPTMHAVDALYKSQRNMSRELNEARKDQEEATAQIEQLKNELKQLRNQLRVRTKNKIKSKKTSRKKK